MTALKMTEFRIWCVIARIGAAGYTCKGGQGECGEEKDLDGF